VAGGLEFLQENGWTLLAVGWATVIGLLVTILVQLFRQRGMGTALEAAPAAGATLAVSKPSSSHVPAFSTLDGPTQIDRMFAILDQAAASADRAVCAHAAAAKQLDSAEYQLQRLFIEFPMLDASRSRQPQLPAIPASGVTAARERALAA
jgi:hypothetical protein